MNFKRLIITTIIIASQLAMVIPVSAEEAGKQDTVSAVGQQYTVTSNNLGANDATTPNNNATKPSQEGQVTNEESTGQETSVTGENGQTEGTGDNNGAEDGQTEQPTSTDEGQDADGSNPSTTDSATTT